MQRAHKVQDCLGGERGRSQFYSYRVKCPKTFNLHCTTELPGEPRGEIGNVLGSYDTRPVYF